MASGQFRVTTELLGVPEILDRIQIDKLMFDILESLADAIVQEARASTAFKDWKK